LSQKRLFIVAVIFLAIAILLCVAFKAFAVDRCAQYVPEERQQHFYYFGLDFPYWYGVGQIQQESRCRADVTAFDGGKGLTQFMPATEAGVEKYLGPLNMYNPSHAIKAQAWYMKQIHKANWNGALWLSYCFYNSGEGTMRKEYKRSITLCHCKETSYDMMKAVCKRRIIQLKSGPLDLCQVGYDYPKQIYKYGQRYKTSSDKVRYW
jgi:soluble lytic murein transglycosylase-like protein